MPDLLINQPGIPEADTCPVLTRLPAHIVPQGVRAVLEHVWRDRQGQPVSLAGESDESESGGAEDVVLRARLHGAPRETVYEVQGEIHDAEGGVVRARLPEEVANQAGIYQLSWALRDDGEIQAVTSGLLSVEPSLYGTTAHHGPPTLQEVRMHLWDSAPAENLLLDDLEFGDEQVILALDKPVQHFNEIPPPLGRTFTASNFPWRDHWLDAAVGHLCEFAAAHYRRNRSRTQAGGVALDDKNKEQEYLREAARRLEAYRSFARAKKVQLNAQQAYGTL